jgi:peroxiredoxin
MKMASSLKSGSLTNRVGTGSGLRQVIGVKTGGGMRKAMALVLALCASATYLSGQQFVDIRVGDKAPDFSFIGIDGNTYRLADYRGKAVVIVWFSPTVMYRGSIVTQRVQCERLRDARDYLKDLNAVYFMVSVSSPQENRQFVDQWCPQATFPVLSDTGGKAAASYGVLKSESGVSLPGGPQTPRGAFTFASTTYIGPDGNILFMEDMNQVLQHTMTYGRDVAVKLTELGVKKGAAAAPAAPQTATSSERAADTPAARNGGNRATTSSAPDIPMISGAWSGNGTDSSGPGEISWDVTLQDGARVSGSFKGRDPSSGLTFGGSLAGQLSSSKLNFTMTVPRGSMKRPYQNCEMTMTGIADVAGNEMRGTYEGSSCGRPVRNGQLTLLRK